MPSPHSLVSRLVATSFGLFMAAYLVVMAVQLIERVWPWLVGTVVVLAAISGVVALLRARLRAW